MQKETRFLGRLAAGSPMYVSLLRKEERVVSESRERFRPEMVALDVSLLGIRGRWMLLSAIAFRTVVLCMI